MNSVTGLYIWQRCQISRLFTSICYGISAVVGGFRRVTGIWRYSSELAFNCRNVTTNNWKYSWNEIGLVSEGTKGNTGANSNEYISAIGCGFRTPRGVSHRIEFLTDTRWNSPSFTEMYSLLFVSLLPFVPSETEVTSVLSTQIIAWGRECVPTHLVGP